jgi:HPt (histidine-containing phosphotransfer) domain-containing protein
MSDFVIPLEMKLAYIERRRNDLFNCRDALNKNSFNVILKVSHQIKGNALSYGYEELGLIANKLEQAALENNTKSIKQLLDLFENFLILNS